MTPYDPSGAPRLIVPPVSAPWRGVLRRHAVAVAIAWLAAACASAPRGAGLELRVLSFNIRYGTADDGPDAWPHRREQVIALLRRQRADLVGMQEVLAFQREEILRALPGYEAFGTGRESDGGGEQSCLLYRSDRFRRVEGGTFWLSESPDTPGSKSWDSSLARICTWARFETLDGRHAFDVFNTHLDHRGATARLEAARLIQHRIAERAVHRPVILTGDFNAGESSPPVRLLLDGSSERGRLADSFRVVRPDARSAGTFHGFKGGRDGEKIDYVLVSPEFEVTTAAVLHDSRKGRYPSDHYPVAARLRLRSR